MLTRFVEDGFYAQEDRPTNLEGPAANTKQRVMKKIPKEVIQNAVGLAIFTTMRSGLWISGAGGSGILMARKEDGNWSPPSGILLHTAGLGFLVGVDIYDCVVVINNRKALESFTKVRATLGGEISAVAGPVGVGGVLENDGKWKELNKPVFTYLKSRGFYAGVQVDGTVVIERTDENERFYGQKIGVADILAGKARHPPHEIKMLMETVKSAEGSSDVDQGMMRELEDQPAPGDVNVENPTQPQQPLFGIPEPDDPDPFGVLALEKAGLEIREAGTKSRPPSSQFEYRPSPTSPIYSTFHRYSMDTLATGSNRGSYASHRTRGSVDRFTYAGEMSTQTDDDQPSTPRTTPGTSPGLGSDNRKSIIQEEEMVKEPEEIDYTKIDLGPFNHLNHSERSLGFHSSGTTAASHSVEPENQDQHEDQREEDIDPFDLPRSNTHDSGSFTNSNEDNDNSSILASDIDTDFDTEDEMDEEPVIFEAATASSAANVKAAQLLVPQIIKVRGNIVDIPKRGPPPPLPPRSAMRRDRGAVEQGTGTTPVATPVASPMRDGFEEVDLSGSTARNSLAVLDTESPKEKVSIEDLEQPTVIDIAVIEEDKTKISHVRDLDHKVAPDAQQKTKEWVGATHDKSPALLSPREDSESEVFHSMPTTPMEVAH